MDFVLDCSIVASFFLPDEHDKKALRILDTLSYKQAVAPVLLRWELSNVFFIALKRNRCSEEDIRENIEALTKLPIHFDTESDFYRLNELLFLSTTHQLSSYDAAYLQTAKKYNIPLLSLDKQLTNAAKKEGIRTSL